MALESDQRHAKQRSRSSLPGGTGWCGCEADHHPGTAFSKWNIRFESAGGQARQEVYGANPIIVQLSVSVSPAGTYGGWL